MKRIYLCILCELLMLILTVVGINKAILDKESSTEEKYHVTMNRITQQLTDGVPLEKIECRDPDIKRIFVVNPKEASMLYECKKSTSYWMIKDESGNISKIVGFEYKDDTNQKHCLVRVNILLTGLAVLTIGIMIFLQLNLIHPFMKLSKVPEQLAKGRVEVPIKESRHRYFGKFVWGLGMLSDAMKTEKEKTLKMSKERHTLLTSISHGIKTPVTNIILYADSIQSGILKGDEVITAAENISANASKITTLINTLLSVSSSFGTELTVECKRFYLKEMFEEIQNYYQEKMRILQIEFSVTYEKNLMITSDQNALITCVSNLIDNAVKYGDGKRIEMYGEIEEDMLLLQVSNTGKAIPTHDMPHIFTSFWRGSNVEEKEGNGLGLYICKTYVNKLGGEIDVSCHDGSTEFVLAVPIDSSVYIVK